MGILGYSRAWRASLLALGMVWFGAANLTAATPDSSGIGTHRRVGRAVRAFRFALSGEACEKKWLSVQRKLDDERVQLALCDGDRERCVSPAALQLLALVDKARAREGRARLGEINRAINLAIRPMSDLAQYGEIDVWSSPLVTFARGAGDCEDYAIAKFVALRLAGVSPDDLRIVIMRDTIHGEDHAVAAARLEDMADAGQPPHGDGRTRCQELPADLCDRWRRRPALRGSPNACWLEDRSLVSEATTNGQIIATPPM